MIELLHAAVLFRDTDPVETERLVTELRGLAWVADLGRMENPDIPWWYIVVDEDPFLLRTETVEKVKAFSDRKPLLFFVSADDYFPDDEETVTDIDSGSLTGLGWGYRLFYQTQEQSRVMFSHQWPSYGDVLKQLLETALTKCDPDKFALFELNETRLNSVKALFDAGVLLKRLTGSDTLEDIERDFARLLGIEADFLGEDNENMG